MTSEQPRLCDIQQVEKVREGERGCAGKRQWKCVETLIFTTYLEQHLSQQAGPENGEGCNATGGETISSLH